MIDPICHTHPDKSVEAVCIRCGANMCAECTRLGELCPACRTATNAANSFVWTKPDQKATFGILWETWKGLAFHPVATGRLIGTFPRMGRAWLFAMITTGLTILANLAFSLFNQIIPAISGEPNALLTAVISIVTFIGSSLGVSLITILTLMLLFSVAQVVLGNRPNFRMTLAVMLYAQVGSLLGLLPCVGGLLVPFGTLIVAGMLLKGMSGEMMGRSLLAVLMPLFIILGSASIAFYIIWKDIGPIVTEAFKALSLVYYQPS